MRRGPDGRFIRNLPSHRQSYAPLVELVVVIVFILALLGVALT